MSYQDMDVDAGAGKYLRVKGGESADIHILTEVPFKMVCHGFGKERLTCAGKECRMCAEGETPKTRWIINVFDRKDNAVKIYEFGPSIARQVKAIAEMLAEQQQTVHDVDLRIKAEGSGMDTEYTVLHRKMTGPMPAELKLHKIP